MNQNEYINKDLAEWLRERGAYHLRAEYVYAWDFDNPSFITMDQLGKEVAEKEREKIGSGGGWCARAYSWYDILVTHAKEFWGEEPESIAQVPAYQWWPLRLMRFLQEERFDLADDLVREHSLFAK